METSEVVTAGDSALNPLDDQSVIKDDELEKVSEEDVNEVKESDQASEVGLSASSSSSITTAVSKKTVSIDTDQLGILLETFVSSTESWRLEKLLRLYSKLSRLADRYAKLFDRNLLIQVCPYYAFIFFISQSIEFCFTLR